MAAAGFWRNPGYFILFKIKGDEDGQRINLSVKLREALEGMVPPSVIEENTSIL